MAAEDDAAGAADAQPAKQDWGADADDNALPPLSNMGWADDDEDELPPLDPTWANLPVPDSPKREKPPAAFKPRDDRGGAEPRASVFSRLGEGGGNAWRRPDAPPDRGGPPDRGPPRDTYPPAGRREDPPRGRREPENPHDWHREQMRLQEAERAARGEPHPHRSQNAPSRSPNANARPQTQQNAMPAEVVYLSRDAQRAAALKREEDAAWRLARDSLATFHATASHSTASHSASHSAAFAPSACREMLNALSEPPFAEGRLAPNARAAFAVVASASKSGAARPERRCGRLSPASWRRCATCWRTASRRPAAPPRDRPARCRRADAHRGRQVARRRAGGARGGGDPRRGGSRRGHQRRARGGGGEIAGGAPRAGQKKPARRRRRRRAGERRRLPAGATRAIRAIRAIRATRARRPPRSSRLRSSESQTARARWSGTRRGRTATGGRKNPRGSPSPARRSPPRPDVSAARARESPRPPTAAARWRRSRGRARRRGTAPPRRLFPPRARASSRRW